MAIAAQVVPFEGDTIWHPIPMKELSLEPNACFSLESLRSSRQVALFLGHDLGCEACRDYARRLSAQADALADVDATPIVVLADDSGSGELTSWRRDLGAGTTIALDGGSDWKKRVFDSVGRSDAEVGLVMLDLFGAPRAGSFGREADELADPSEAAGWLLFAAMDCPECTTELPQPEPAEAF